MKTPSPGLSTDLSHASAGAVTQDLLERARRVRVLVLDVDGVLTDGRLHITAQGEETKVFHVRDGSGNRRRAARRHHGRHHFRP